MPDMRLNFPIRRFPMRFSAAAGLAALLLAMMVLLVPSARAGMAQDGPPKRFSEIHLRAAPVGMADRAQLVGGIEIITRPGWKTYWRAAGEAGLPPQFTWLLAENVQTPEILWPVPTRFLTDGLESYGYDNGVVLPFRLYPADPAKPVRLHLRARYAVCLEICVPEEADLTLTIPPGGAQSEPDVAARLERALQQVPPLQSDDDAFNNSLRIQSVKLIETAQAAVLAVTAQSQTGFLAPDLFVDGTDAFLFAAPETELTADGLHVSFRVPVTALVPGASLKGHKVRFTLVDQGRGVEYAAAISN